MRDKLYKIINIRFSESTQVFDLLTVQFFIGLANALVNIMAFTLFIYNFPITALPGVYLIVAVVLILMNIAYQKLEHTFKPIQLMRLVLVFSAALLLLLWTGLAIGYKDTFIYIFVISSVILYMVTGYAFWGMVSLLFNVRESRRVFSIIGAGDIPAKLIGYLAVPLLIPLVGLKNIPWFALGSFIIALVLFSRYSHKESWRRLKSHHIPHDVQQVVGKKDIISFFFGHRLIFAISLLSILSYNVFILIDYTFLSQVKARFGNIAELASYVAIFFALGRVIALIFKLIFTSRVIERFGVVQCLFITPVVLLLFCFVLIGYGYNNEYTIYIFGLMAMLTEVLRSTMQEPVFFILFQPLKEQLRLKGHIISKGYMYPPSLLIVGTSLWVLHRSGNDITIVQAVKVILFNIFIWAAIIFFIGKAYLQTIHASIKKGIFSGSDVHVYDHHTIRILLDKINHNNPRETIYALDLLEKAGYENIVEVLEQQLNCGNADIQKYVLYELDKKNKINPSLLRKMLTGKNDEIYPVMVSLLCKYDQLFLDEMAADLSMHDYQVRKDIIIQLLDKREFRHLLKAGTEINNLIQSGNLHDQELAIDIISEMKHLKFDDIILNMIRNGEHSVKRKAILAACKLNQKALLPELLEMLNNPADRYIVLKGLLVYGDALFEHISAMPDDIIKNFSSELIRTAGQVKGIHSKEFLVSRLREQELNADKVLHALWSRDYFPDNNEEKALLTTILQKHISEGMQKIGDMVYITEGHYKKIVKDSVYNEIHDHLTMCLKICSFLFHKKEVNRVLELLESDNKSKIYNAMEMLDLVLPKRISKDINHLFEFVLDSDGIPVLRTAKEKNFLNEVIYQEGVSYNAWTKSICIYCSWKYNETHVLNKLSSLVIPEGNHVLRETKDYVLKELKSPTYADY